VSVVDDVGPVQRCPCGRFGRREGDLDHPGTGVDKAIS
jgi:hypothetical protein